MGKRLQEVHKMKIISERRRKREITSDKMATFYLSNSEGNV